MTTLSSLLASLCPWRKSRLSCRGVWFQANPKRPDHGQRPGFAWKVPAGGKLPCPSVSGTALHHSLWREFQGMRQAPRLPAQVSGFLASPWRGFSWRCSALFPTLTQYVFTPSPSSRHAPNPYPYSLAHKRAGALFRTPRECPDPSLLSTPGPIHQPLTLPCPVGRRGPRQPRPLLPAACTGVVSEPRLAMTLGSLSSKTTSTPAGSTPASGQSQCRALQLPLETACRPSPDLAPSLLPPPCTLLSTFNHDHAFIHLKVPWLYGLLLTSTVLSPLSSGTRHGSLQTFSTSPGKNTVLCTSSGFILLFFTNLLFHRVFLDFSTPGCAPSLWVPSVCLYQSPSCLIFA